MLVDQKLKKSFIGIYLIDNDVNGVQLATTSKPNWFRRVIIRIFLGWKWISVSDLKNLK